MDGAVSIESYNKKIKRVIISEQEIKKKCEDNELCPKQVATDNRVIPYQLYYAELKKILENAAKGVL